MNSQFQKEREKYLSTPLSEEEKKILNTPLEEWNSRDSGGLILSEEHQWINISSKNENGSKIIEEEIVEFISHLDNSPRRFKLKKEKIMKEVNANINSKIFLFQGNITVLKCDAIVNAANRTLLGGGGVDEAVHKGAGKLLVIECAKLNGCETCECKITKGFDLPSRFVIHSVGPLYFDPNPEQRLTKTYMNILKCCVQNGVKSVAIPCISGGFYGFPLDLQAKVAVRTMRKFLEDRRNEISIEQVVFCTYTDQETKAYKHFLPVFFPK